MAGSSPLVEQTAYYVQFKTGLRTEPYGISFVTDALFEAVPLITTICFFNILISFQSSCEYLYCYLTFNMNL